MDDPTIRPATEADLDLLDAGLRTLSATLGDRHRAGREDLRRAGFGPAPAFHALIVEDAAALQGLIMFSPVFSTIRGAAGLFVSDLWVAEGARGGGLGPRLLSGAARQAATAWGARFLRLTVYDDNPAAWRFYERLGMTPEPGNIIMTLDEDGLNTLKGTT